MGPPFMVAIDKGQVLAAQGKLTDDQLRRMQSLPLTCVVNLKIHELRKARGLSLEKFGELMGTTQETASRLENGKLPLNYKWLLLAAGALAVEPAAIFNALEMRDEEERHLLAQYRRLRAGDQDRLLNIVDAFAGPLDGGDENIYERERRPHNYHLHDK